MDRVNPAWVLAVALVAFVAVQAGALTGLLTEDVPIAVEDDESESDSFVVAAVGTSAPEVSVMVEPTEAPSTAPVSTPVTQAAPPSTTAPPPVTAPPTTRRVTAPPRTAPTATQTESPPITATTTSVAVTSTTAPPAGLPSAEVGDGSVELDNPTEQVVEFTVTDEASQTVVKVEPGSTVSVETEGSVEVELFDLVIESTKPTIEPVEHDGAGEDGKG